jgi:hypothetical protein
MDILIPRVLFLYGYADISATLEKKVPRGLEILEYCDKADCVYREQYYMDTLRPFYNICSKAGSSLGRLTTNATRLKLRRGGGGLVAKAA